MHSKGRREFPLCAPCIDNMGKRNWEGLDISKRLEEFLGSHVTVPPASPVPQPVVYARKVPKQPDVTPIRAFLRGLLLGIIIGVTATLLVLLRYVFGFTIGT